MGAANEKAATWCLAMLLLRALLCLPAVLLLPTVAASNNLQTEMGKNITKILNGFFANKRYDKRVRPNYAGPPVEVGVTMYIISISSVSEVQMDFTCDFYFRQSWNDSRLSFKQRGGITALNVGSEVAKLIWVPDTFFANEKSAKFHEATTANTFIRLRANGNVFRSTRLTVTSSCPMNLRYFPMDRQECTIEVESYGYSMADILYRWGIDKADDPQAAKMSPNVELPQFKVKNLEQHSKVEYLTSGNYSRLVCQINFVRSMGYYLIQIYIPASLIVIISWVSFWLHRNASPARVQLGVTTVLTMTTLMSSTNAALPKISYIKSIDVFLGTCFVMVFASLLEYATVGYMGKRIAMRTARIQAQAKVATARRAAAAAAAAAAAKENNSVFNHHHHYLESGLTGGRADPHGHSHHVPSKLMGSSPYASDPMLASSVECGNSCSGSTFTSPRLSNAAMTTEMRYRAATLQGGGGGGRPSVDYSSRRRMLSIAAVAEPTEPNEAPREPGSSATTQSAPAIAIPGVRNQNSLFGICPSDIDKYSRVVFPVCFLCFNLMYWVIYTHISEFFTEDDTN